MLGNRRQEIGVVQGIDDHEDRGCRQHDREPNLSR